MDYLIDMHMSLNALQNLYLEVQIWNKFVSTTLFFSIIVKLLFIVVVNLNFYKVRTLARITHAIII